ncbi:MAG: LytS/YhcK type 5TM receptor domain-containing protein, partial [Tumebacillaceae bacterium]
MSEWVFGLMSGMASILCMGFPIVAGDGFIWDLRWIPYVIGHLYGGWRGGVISLVMVVGYRGYLSGGVPFYTTCMLGVLVTLVLPLWRERFRSYDRRRKFLFVCVLAVLMYVCVMGIICSYFYAIDNVAYLLDMNKWLYGFIAMSYVLGMILSVFLIENIFENAKIREEVQRTEKLNIISQLAASVAHEVRNPLTVVRGFIQLARSSMDTTNQGYMDTAIAELDRAEFI